MDILLEAAKVADQAFAFAKLVAAVVAVGGVTIFVLLAAKAWIGDGR